MRSFASPSRLLFWLKLTVLCLLPASAWAGDELHWGTNPNMRCWNSLRILAGDKPILINGVPTTIGDRSVSLKQNQHDEAYGFLREQAISLNLPFEEQVWTETVEMNEHDAGRFGLVVPEPELAPAPPSIIVPSPKKLELPREPEKKKGTWLSQLRRVWTRGGEVERPYVAPAPPVAAVTEPVTLSSLLYLPPKSIGPREPLRIRAKVPLRQLVVTVDGIDPVLKHEVVVAGAHYDTVNSLSAAWMGTRHEYAAAPGADDNGTGVAATLALMEHFKTHPPKCTVKFVFWDAEEPGLLSGARGSHYFINSMEASDRKAIKVAFVFDMLGQKPRYNPHGYGAGTQMQEGYNVSAMGVDPVDLRQFLLKGRTKDSDPVPLVQGPRAPNFIPLSDNGPIMDRGVNTVLITDVVTLSHLPRNYHSENDGMKHIDQPFFFHLVSQAKRLVDAAANE